MSKTVTMVLAVVTALAMGSCTTTAPNHPAPTIAQKSQATPATARASATVVSNGYPYGTDTWYVASRRQVPPSWGSARKWFTRALADGFNVGTQPIPGAIAWANNGHVYHVAYVESVSGDGDNVTVSETGLPNGWDRVTVRTVSAKQFLYIY